MCTNISWPMSACACRKIRNADDEVIESVILRILITLLKSKDKTSMRCLLPSLLRGVGGGWSPSFKSLIQHVSRVCCVSFP